VQAFIPFGDFFTRQLANLLLVLTLV